MRKIVAAEFVSLDGVMESVDTWHFPYYNEEMGAVQAAEMAEVDTILLGRRTYMVDPILVGTGKHLFAQDGDQMPLKLVGSQTFSTGVLSLVYAPADKYRVDSYQERPS